MEAEPLPPAAQPPVDATPFIGRRAEVADVRQLITTSRLTTLVGAGGVGKTRIAFHVADSLRRTLRDGILIVDLAAADGPHRVLDELISSLMIATSPTSSQLDMLTATLMTRDTLLVLDTCEHVIEPCAQVVAHLLRHTDGLRILATSREPLNLPIEHVFSVTPFRVMNPSRPTEPGPDAPAAVQLFADRAKAVVSDFYVSPGNRADIEAVCHQLDGLPLAIELAALQVPLFTVHDLLARLRERLDATGRGPRSAPARHATLDAALDWSYELCAPNEQALWLRSSVFSGGFTLAAAEVVCTDSEFGVAEVLPGLSGLLSKSILLRERSNAQVRFRLLNVVRDYGLRRLEQPEPRRDAHAGWVEKFARQGSSTWFGPHQRSWLDRCEVERGNIRAALAHSLTQSGSTRALEIASSLWFYWMSAGHLDEGTSWLEQGLANSASPSPQRNRALWLSGLFAILRLHPDDAEAWSTQCLLEATPVGDVAATANAKHVLGLSAFVGGDLLLAESCLLDALADFRRAGLHDSRSVMAQIHLAMTYAYSDRVDEAMSLAEGGRIECVSAGDQWVAAYAMQTIGLCHFLRNDAKRGLRAGLAGLALSKRLGDARALTPRLDMLGWMAAAEGDSPRAATLLGAAEALWTQHQSPSYRSKQLMAMRERAVERAKADLGSTAFAAAKELGAEFDLDQALAYALDERPGRSVPEQRRNLGLTTRELEIARHVAAGLSNKAIAHLLVLSPRTVENHVQKILTKLGFNSRTQIAVWALGHDATQLMREHR